MSIEHVDYRWLPLAEAREHIPYPSQRLGMELAEERLRAR
jgi:8-oxo-dGTP pyrophosphatase MutT (NUDIX family)